jgi:dipeptidyl aminopeptidase/acylaminoacyl peptidase
VPIVGPAGRMNDNYVPDLRNGLWAAIDECDKRGYIDRDRLACGGHSYGAFSTANALAHTPFFKAGIAGDGCYNRTLTSMSFQSERRQLWDARETYLEMSPLTRTRQPCPSRAAAEAAPQQLRPFLNHRSDSRHDPASARIG